MENFTHDEIYQCFKYLIDYYLSINQKKLFVVGPGIPWYELQVNNTIIKTRIRELIRNNNFEEICGINLVEPFMWPFYYFIEYYKNIIISIDPQSQKDLILANDVALNTLTNSIDTLNFYPTLPNHSLY